MSWDLKYLKKNKPKTGIKKYITKEKFTRATKAASRGVSTAGRMTYKALKKASKPRRYYNVAKPPSPEQDIFRGL
jgi:hypothetical protein